LVEQSGASLSFEVKDHVRQRVPFEQVLAHHKRERPDRAFARGAFDNVNAFGGDAVEFDGPEMPILPLPDRPGFQRRAGKHLFIGRILSPARPPASGLKARSLDDWSELSGSAPGRTGRWKSGRQTSPAKRVFSCCGTPRF